MDLDLMQFRDRFVEDATNLLMQLESDLLALESDKENNELIESVFRAMHTLKGTAGMYGFDQVGEYTHTLESIYEFIRRKDIVLSQEIFNITFQSVDHLRKLFKDVNFSNEENIKRHKELLAQIENILESKNLIPLNTKTGNKREQSETKSTGTNTYFILLRTSESLIKRGIKIAIVLNELYETGKCYIDDKFTIEGDDPSHNEEYWPIIVTTKANIVEIEDIFLFLSGDYKVILISRFDLFKNFPALNKNKDDEDETILQTIEKFNLLQKEGKLEEYKNKLTDDKEVDKSTVKKTVKQNTEINILKAAETQRITVDSSKLDYLMYLVGELVTVNSQLILSTNDSCYDNIRQYLKQVDKLSKLFRDNALDLRLIPIKGMVLRFKRLIRDLSNKLGKEVIFQVQGEETELDKSTIDILAEPLMHIIRNCLDHGIEAPEKREKLRKTLEGQVNFFAYHQGNNVFINIQDDGAGIDTKKIREKAIEKGFISADAKLTKQEILELIFLPGFSTAQNLTQVSGRGVGMDVVRRKISEVRGEVEVTSEPGLGTSFTIKLQQSILILDTMLIKVADLFYMLPLSEVEVCRQYTSIEIEKRKYSKTLPFKDALIPFIDLRDISELIESRKNPEQNKNPENEIEKKDETNRKALIINRQDKKFTLISDQIIGEHQAVLRPLGKTFKNQEFFTSASILADGEMALMLDTRALQKKLV